MGPSSPDTRNTRDSTTSTPRLGTRLVASFGGDCIGLPLVLPHVGVHKLDHVGPDGRLEDGRERGLPTGLATIIKHGN